MHVQKWLRFLLVPACLVLLTATVSAAAPPAEGGKKEAEGIMDFKADTALWSAVVFILLLLILRKAAWGPILEGLHKREETIRQAAEEAKLARVETEKIRQETRAELDRRSKEIADMMAEARRDAEVLKEQMRTEAGTEIQKERQRLHRELETARDQALQEIWTQAAQLATLISTKAVGKSLTVEDHRRLIDESLAELRKNSI